MKEKKPLIILTGPTSVGKTKLSILLAQRVQGEILSADSMQVYRHMDIGSAKIRPEETKGVPHHLIDIREPDESFDIRQFQTLAKRTIAEIYERGRLPILVGGTGFYIQSVLYDIAFAEEENDGEYRRYLEKTAKEQGAEFLHRMLSRADPDAALAIHPNNQKRVIRALEYHKLTGKRISEHNARERRREAAYRFCYFVLNDDRSRIYERIDERVDRMMEEGLAEEVKRLRQMGCGRDLVSMQGLGYKEILSCLEGEISMEEAVYRIKRDTRHFAKRQLTWFRRERDVIWLEKSAFAYDDRKILDYMLQKMKEKGIGTER